MSNAVYYVSYTLKKGASVSDFLLAAERLNNEYISKQKGYISWKQLVDGKTWADVCTFETMDDLNNFKAASRKPNEIAKKFYSYLNPFSCKQHAFSVEKITRSESKNMEKFLYVMFIEKGKTYNKITKAAVERHVANIKRLDDNGKLELCGVFKGYPGVAGMLILKTQSYEEAEEICKTEPLVAEGYATYKLHALQVANKDNNYLL